MAVSGASSSSLTVIRSLDSVTVIRQTGITANSYSSPSTLQAGTFRAWVRAVSTSGEVSIWSRFVEFTVASNSAEVSVESAFPDVVSTPLLALLKSDENVADKTLLGSTSPDDPAPISIPGRLHPRTVARRSAMAASVNHESELSVAENPDLQDALFSLDPGFIVEQAASYPAARRVAGIL